MVNILEKLTRATNSKKFIPEIDGFRFLAIVPVVLMHFNTYFSKSIGRDFRLMSNQMNTWDWFFTKGEIGVDLFFAISGFILGLPFIKAYVQKTTSPKLSNYYYRRLTRLEPPFIITLIIFYLTHIFINGESFYALFDNFIASLFYVHYFVYGKWSVINPVTWSLETEVQFYMLAPFLCALFFKKTKKIFMAFIMIILTILSFIIISNIFVETYMKLHLSKSILLYLPNFLVGFLIASLFVVKNNFLKKQLYLYDVIGLTSFYLMFVTAKENRYLFIMFLFFLFISVFKGKLLNKFFRIKIIYVIGGMCYSIYLIHYAFFHFIVNFTKDILIFDEYILNFLVQAIIVFPIMFTVCSIFYILVEKPCMDKDWPKKLVIMFKSKTS